MADEDGGHAPDAVTRARTGDLTAWVDLLPPGWLGERPSRPPRSGPRHLARRRRVPPKVAVAGIVAVAVALLAVASARPPAHRAAVPPPPAPLLPPVLPSAPLTPSPSAPVASSPPASSAPAAGVPYAPAPVPRWGYAWMDESTAPPGTEVGLDPQWQWTTARLDRATAGRRATVVHRDAGSYTVRLPGAGYPSGIAHVTSFATLGRYRSALLDGHSCAVAGYHQSGVDELVDVRCTRADGTPLDVQFDVFFSAPNAGSGSYASVRYDPPGGGSLVPVRNSGTANTTGGANAVYQLDTGRWRAVLPGLPATGYAQVTPYGSGTPARCQPESAGPADSGGVAVVVACYAITTGPTQPVNSSWLLSYAQRAGLQHAGSAAAYAVAAGDPGAPVVDGRRAWASTGETPTVSRLAVGSYRLAYDTVGIPDDAPLVTAVGTAPRHCRLTWWNSYSAPPRVTIDVYCYDSAGNRADALFAVAYLRSP